MTIGTSKLPCFRIAISKSVVIKDKNFAQLPLFNMGVWFRKESEHIYWFTIIILSSVVCKHKKQKEEESSTSQPVTSSGCSTQRPMGATVSLPPTSNTHCVSGFFRLFCQLMHGVIQTASLCCALWNRWSWKMPYFFLGFFILFCFVCLFHLLQLFLLILKISSNHMILSFCDSVTCFTLSTLRELRKLIVPQKL